MEITATEQSLSTETAQCESVMVERRGSVVRAYYELTKPGITQMVVLTAAAGYYLAVGDNHYFTSVGNILRFLLAMVGTALISAGSCALNQYLERQDDARMNRTKSRPIPTGIISPTQALLFGCVLSVAGALALATINTLTLVLAIATHLSYIAFYTPLKKRSWLAMLVGGVPGALPAMGGWTAYSGSIDGGAWILFAIMFVWQMPHFLALAIMYRNDYIGGGFVLLGNETNGKTRSAIHALVYAIILLPLSVALTLVGVTGMLYLSGAIVLSGLFIYEAYKVVGDASVANARRMLLTSYAFLMGIFLFMFVDKV